MTKITSVEKIVLFNDAFSSYLKKWANQIPPTPNCLSKFSAYVKVYIALLFICHVITVIACLIIFASQKSVDLLKAIDNDFREYESNVEGLKKKAQLFPPEIPSWNDVEALQPRFKTSQDRWKQLKLPLLDLKKSVSAGK